MKGSAPKWAGFIFFLLAIIAINHFLPYFVRPTQKSEPQAEQIDEYMLNAKAVRFDKAGQYAEKLELEAVYHVQGKDYMILKQPHLTLFRPSMNWSIKANAGRSYLSPKNHFEQIDLNDHVEILFQNQPGSWLMQTDRLTLYPEAQTASTDAPVSIFSDQLLVESVGMQSDLQKGEVILEKEVSSFYEIPSRS